MADFQYQADMNDPVSQLKMSMNDMNGKHVWDLMQGTASERCPVDGILQYSMPEEQEDYIVAEDSMDMDVDIDPQLKNPVGSSSSSADAQKIRSNLRLPPPPLFSRQAVPQLYKCASISPVYL